MSDQAEAKGYWVEGIRSIQGGIPEKFTLPEARRIAKEMSIDHSEAIAVCRDPAYTPEVIFYCGREYRPVEGE